MRKKILQLKNFGLFVSALMLVLFFSRKKVINNPKRICIIQLSKLGDMVCTTPMFRAIKEKFPDAEVCVVGDSINKQVLAGNLDVDKYITFNHTNFSDVIHQVRKNNPDFTCITGTDFTSLLISIFAGIRSIATFKMSGGKTTETRTYALLLQFVHTVPYTFGTYSSRAQLRLLEYVGITSEDTTKHLYITNEAKKEIEMLFIHHGIKEKDFLVGISPSAGNRIKQWFPERFAEVANYLSEHYRAKIIVIAGPNDEKEVNLMLKNLNDNTETINTAGTLSIEKLKALVSRLDLFISVDTGPIYIAEAFKIPTIDITGPIDEREQPPIGTFHKVVVPANRKGPELFLMDAHSYNYDEARRQVESITTEMVIHTLKELYPLIKK